ncbi:hypothetical protein BDV95DRAFT_599923 [Massariosphaeria phaeospora]|uniref:Uncharacterized protein n=1 Tax=Massariosphaeria phaeospora TaxID=100035 RepID=A0A7C8HYQ1_9PLEO|nr:hypothetical protein BDV95DRAFT_599923 [Massariosphaeria phaeospora]
MNLGNWTTSICLPRLVPQALHTTLVDPSKQQINYEATFTDHVSAASGSAGLSSSDGSQISELSSSASPALSTLSTRAAPPHPHPPASCNIARACFFGACLIRACCPTMFTSRDLGPMLGNPSLIVYSDRARFQGSLVLESSHVAEGGEAVNVLRTIVVGKASVIGFGFGCARLRPTGAMLPSRRMLYSPFSRASISMVLDS